MNRAAIDVRIERVADIDDELRDEIERWTDAQFGHIRYVWAPSEWYAIARVDGRLAGTLTLVTREVAAGRERVRVAGIGNVVTKPEYRLRGVASAMMRAASDLMRTALEVEFGADLPARGRPRLPEGRLDTSRGSHGIFAAEGECDLSARHDDSETHRVRMARRSDRSVRAALFEAGAAASIPRYRP